MPPIFVWLPLLGFLWDKHALEAVEWVEDSFAMDMPVAKEFLQHQPSVERRLRDLLQSHGLISESLNAEPVVADDWAEPRELEEWTIDQDTSEWTIDEDTGEIRPSKEDSAAAKFFLSMLGVVIFFMFIYTILFVILDLNFFLTIVLPVGLGMCQLPQQHVVEWIAVAVVACVYQRSINSKRQQYNKGDRMDFADADFIAGVFDCCSECDYCCYGFFCAPCRYADTVSAIGVCNYGLAASLLIGCPAFLAIAPRLLAMISSNGLESATNKLATGQMSTEDYVRVVVGSSGIWVFPLRIIWSITVRVVLVCTRPKIRSALGRNPQCTCADFCMWWFCPWCALCQEARDVDMETKTKAACCFTLKTDDAASVPLVGAAVNVEMRDQHPGMPVYAGQVQYVQQGGQGGQPVYAQAPLQFAQGTAQPVQYAVGPGVPQGQLQFIAQPGSAPPQQVQYVQGAVMDVPPAASQAMQQS